ncbi:MAG: hypothetical protein HQL16_03725 [Candidatus Omnitrophica bacterium]|nr:hypothetical protein [Candidatus Omnitrophota bacterium]
MKMPESREWRRCDVSFPAKCWAKASPQNQNNINIININGQGFCFSSLLGFESGDKLGLEMALQGVGKARLNVQVIWSGFLDKEKSFYSGVRIVNTDQNEHEKFLKFYNLKLLSLPALE